MNGAIRAEKGADGRTGLRRWESCQRKSPRFRRDSTKIESGAPRPIIGHEHRRILRGSQEAWLVEGGAGYVDERVGLVPDRDSRGERVCRMWWPVQGVTPWDSDRPIRDIGARLGRVLMDRGDRGRAENRCRGRSSGHESGRGGTWRRFPLPRASWQGRKRLRPTLPPTSGAPSDGKATWDDLTAQSTRRCPRRLSGHPWS